MPLARRPFLGIVTAAPMLAVGTPVAAATRLDGRRIVYEVAGYRIRMEFVGEVGLRWTYLAAPTPAEVGKSDLERCDRVDLRPELVLMAWSETRGTHVVDVFDFENAHVHANFVMPDGKRYRSQAAFTREM